MQYNTSIAVNESVFLQNRSIIMTEDGSPSIILPKLNITFHNIHGAILESRIVYIRNGLQYFAGNTDGVSVFEMGLGTGLNAMLSWEYGKANNKIVRYTAVECYPLEEGIWTQYIGNNYFSLQQKSLLEQIHLAKWEDVVQLDPHFSLVKKKCSLLDFETFDKFDVIYFDAFDPASQSELWTESVFCKIFNVLNDNGVMVTYCSKGSIRRLLEKIGFLIEKLPGPPGKREVMRARKQY